MCNKWILGVFSAVQLTLLGLCGVCQPAFADQTDKRLDSLFEELRTGGALNAQANVDRIMEIWSDSQSDTVDILYGRALAKYHEGDFQTAGHLLTYVRGLSPNYMQGYALSGFLKLRINDQAAALRDFSRALDLEPRQFEVRKALAQLLIASNEKRAAYDMLQEALAWNPFDDDMLSMARKLLTDLQGQDI